MKTYLALRKTLSKTEFLTKEDEKELDSLYYLKASGCVKVEDFFRNIFVIYKVPKESSNNDSEGKKLENLYKINCILKKYFEGGLEISDRLFKSIVEVEKDKFNKQMEDYLGALRELNLIGTQDSLTCKEFEKNVLMKLLTPKNRKHLTSMKTVAGSYKVPSSELYEISNMLIKDEVKSNYETDELTGDVEIERYSRDILDRLEPTIISSEFVYRRFLIDWAIIVKGINDSFASLADQAEEKKLEAENTLKKLEDKSREFSKRVAAEISAEKTLKKKIKKEYAEEFSNLNKLKRELKKKNSRLKSRAEERDKKLNKVRHINK